MRRSNKTTSKKSNSKIVFFDNTDENICSNVNNTYSMFGRNSSSSFMPIRKMAVLSKFPKSLIRSLKEIKKRKKKKKGLMVIL